jgi:hypothetical protein
MKRASIWSSRNWARRRVAALVAAGVFGACADFDGIVNPTGGLPDVVVEVPQFNRDIIPIFERRCGIGGCHSAAAHQAGLVLTAGVAHAALVNKPAQTRPGEVLVRPGNADNSWLVIAIRDNDARRMGLARMPLASGPLTPNQIQTIVNWVNRGAPND